MLCPSEPVIKYQGFSTSLWITPSKDTIENKEIYSKILAY
jgi:hypothetical protein